MQAQTITETTFVTIALVCLVAAFHWLTDKGLDGQTNWQWLVSRYFVTSSAPRQLEEKSDVDEPFDEEEEEGIDGIAKPDNTSNEVLYVAERAKVQAIAALIAESRRKSFQNGEVPETRALTSVFGVTVSSKEGSEYKRLRAMLKEQLAKLEQPAAAPRFPTLTEEQQLVRRELGLEGAE